VARRKMKNLYFKKKIPVEKLMPKRENKTAKQEEQKAVAKIAEKIPDKVPRIPTEADFISGNLIFTKYIKKTKFKETKIERRPTISQSFICQIFK
jgi:hypothetical protein